VSGSEAPSKAFAGCVDYQGAVVGSCSAEMPVTCGCLGCSTRVPRPRTFGCNIPRCCPDAKCGPNASNVCPASSECCSGPVSHQERRGGILRWSEVTDAPLSLDKSLIVGSPKDDSLQISDLRRISDDGYV
jgi:hypothetical protein